MLQEELAIPETSEWHDLLPQSVPAMDLPEGLTPVDAELAGDNSSYACVRYFGGFTIIAV